MTNIITPNAARTARKAIRDALAAYRDLRAAALLARRDAVARGRKCLDMEDADNLVHQTLEARSWYYGRLAWLASRTIETGAAWSPNALARRRNRR